jgi:hypothetical protein
MRLKQPSVVRKNAKLTNQASATTLETYLTDPLYFGLETATELQRAKCRIVTGLPLGILAKRADVLEMCGGKVPSYAESAREILDISAIRIGKSLFAAALILWLSQTVDLSGTRPSDIVRIFVVALKIGGTEAVLKHLMDSMLTKPALRELLVDEPKEITLGTIKTSGLRIRQQSSGKTIEVVPIPLDRAGGSAVSVYCAGVVVDEYPRMIGAEDGVRNVEHFHEAVVGRLLPGAVYLATGSPWQPYGPAYDNTIKFFGKPSEDLIVLRTSAKPFIDIAPAWTKSKGKYPHEVLQRTSPLAYKTDFLAEFADGEQAVFPAQAIEDAWNRPQAPNAEYGKPAIFADPSALRHDYWAAMVAGWVHPVSTPEDIYECQVMGDVIVPGPPGQVVQGRSGWIRILEDANGSPIPRRDGKGLKPWLEVYEIVSWDKASGARGLDLIKAVGALGRKYGVEDFHFDGYEQLMISDLIRHEALRPVVHPWSSARKTEAVDHLRSLLVDRRVRLPAHDLLKGELLRFRSRASPGGAFSYIVAGGAGHGDHASCLTLASRADLDGYVDRSPTARVTARHEVPDWQEQEYALDY